jgi:hypothetical protein
MSMTVRALIAALKKLPPTAKIAVCAHDQSAEHGEFDGFARYVELAPPALKDRGAGVVIQL